MENWSPKNLLKSLKLGENSRIEAKPCTEGVGDSCLQTICAFANEPGLCGGFLLLGVRETGKKFQPVGVENPDHILNDLFSKIRASFNTPPIVREHIESVSGKTLIALRVEELESSRKPCEFVGKIDGRNKRRTGVWRRHLNGDYECDFEALTALLSERDGAGFEASAIPDAGEDDIDPDVVARYRRLRERVRPDAPELLLSDEELLCALCALKKTDSGRLVPTAAGLLLFGKKTSLRRLMPAARVDYIRLPGNEWLEDPEKRFEYSTDFLEPLITLLPRLEAAVMDDIPRTFALKDGLLQREDMPILPQQVVREALVNALMHRDYRENRPTQILRFRGRVEIHNAGRSLKSLHLLGKAGSVLRNPKIAAVLYDLQFAETKGTGIGQMRRLLAQNGLSSPEFSSDIHGNEFCAKYFLHHLFGEDQLEWLKRLGIRLSGEEATALLLAKSSGHVCSADMRERSGLDTLGISGVFRSLRKKGLLEKSGTGAKTFYVPTQKTLDANAPEKTCERMNLSGKGMELESKGMNLPPKGMELEDEGMNLEATRKEFKRRLDALSKKSSRDEMEFLVLALCEDSPKTLDELSAALSRGKNKLRLNVVKPLCEGNLLSRLYPDKKNHPRQAYRLSPQGEARLNELRNPQNENPAQCD